MGGGTRTTDGSRRCAVGGYVSVRRRVPRQPGWRGWTVSSRDLLPFAAVATVLSAVVTAGKSRSSGTAVLPGLRGGKCVRAVRAGGDGDGDGDGRNRLRRNGIAAHSQTRKQARMFGGRACVARMFAWRSTSLKMPHAYVWSYGRHACSC